MALYKGHSEISGVLARSIRDALRYDDSDIVPVQIAWNGKIRVVTIEDRNLLRTIVEGGDAVVLREIHKDDGWEATTTVYNNSDVERVEKSGPDADPVRIFIDRVGAIAVRERVKACFDEIARTIPSMRKLSNLSASGFEIFDGGKLKEGPWIFPTSPEAKKNRPNYLRVVNST